MIYFNNAKINAWNLYTQYDEAFWAICLASWKAWSAAPTDEINHRNIWLIIYFILPISVDVSIIFHKVICLATGRSFCCCFRPCSRIFWRSVQKSFLSNLSNWVLFSFVRKNALKINRLINILWEYSYFIRSFYFKNTFYNITRSF